MENKERQKVSSDILRRLADYAGVKLSQERLERTRPRLEPYLNDVSRLDDVDVTDIEPAVTFSLKRAGNDAR